MIRIALKFCISVFVLQYIFIASALVKDDVYVKQFQIDEDLFYVICTQDGTELHEPLPYFISPTSEGNMKNDYQIFSYYNPDSDDSFSAVYVESTHYFSGFIFNEIHGFSEELAAVSLKTNQKYGYIAPDGKVVIPFQWEWAEDFKNGIALITYETSDGYGNAWIDKTGEIVSIDLQWGYSIQNS
ncbi:MAG: WG repeat-containing protein [Eubacteriales bacterium]|nr:WG repeat-containing protein [Eubacteriales bacterium]